MEQLRLPPDQRISAKIWADVQHLDLKMYGLPNQPINKFCNANFADPLKLRLTYSTSMVVPCLETALNGRYELEVVGSYIELSPKEPK